MSETVEQKDGGVLHVYGIEVEKTTKKSRRGKQIEQSLAFKVVAEGFQSKGVTQIGVIDEVTAMSSSYALRIDDQVTSRDELKGYLELAQHLKLLPDSEGAIDSYLDEVAASHGLGAGDDFGPVNLQYRLNYNGSALLKVFQALTKKQIEFVAVATLRATGVQAYRDAEKFTQIASAYPETAIWKEWNDKRDLKTNRLNDVTYTITTPSGEKRITLSRQERLNLSRLYEIEHDFIKALESLRGYVNREKDKRTTKNRRKKRIDNLEKRLQEFVGFDKQLRKWTGFNERAVVPPFLSVLNQLTSLVQTRNKAWQTTLELAFIASQDEGEFEKGEVKVKKLLMR